MIFYNINKPFDVHRIKVSDIHEIYIEEYGNKKGVPLIFLHGGPGAGTSPIYQKYFNPEKYHLIMFDQRGCGKSIPYGEISQNSTDHLIADISSIADYLSVEKFHIYGGSWGSTLALLYAEACPERVISLVLRGVFLCRRNDIQWFYQYGASEIYPAYWEDYISIVDKARTDNILTEYHKMIFSDDETLANKACKEWSLWEGRSSCLYHTHDVVNAFDECSVSLARIESHFFVNECFIEENQIIKNIDKISHIPCTIVHGQYDVVCPIRQAYDLNQAYLKSRLIVAEDAGHSLLEPTISKEILSIFDELVV
jgi:proline iminopeptidase